MKKLLVTGASGFLGWNVCRLAQESYHVIGFVQNNSTKLPIEEYSMDLCEYEVMKSAVRSIKPDAIIHTAAQSNASICQQNIKETNRINTQAALDMAELASEANIPLVFTSTDLVFDGSEGNYCEENIVNPINVYGEQKASAETIISSIYPKALICRLPLMLGYSATNNGNYLMEFLSNVHNGKELTLFKDEYRTPVGAISIAKALLQFIGKQSGLLHLGGLQCMNRVELGNIIKEVFVLEDAKIKSISQDDIKLGTPRPKDASLSSDKAVSLGFNPLKIKDELTLVRQLFY